MAPPRVAQCAMAALSASTDLESVPASRRHVPCGVNFRHFVESHEALPTRISIGLQTNSLQMSRTLLNYRLV